MIIKYPFLKGTLLATIIIQKGRSDIRYQLNNMSKRSELYTLLSSDEIEFWFMIQPKPASPAESVKEEEKSLAKDKATTVHLESENLPGNIKRKSSINLYQSVDDDHPDLQSIQNIVANMTFSADWISLGHWTCLRKSFPCFCFIVPSLCKEIISTTTIM